MIGDNVRGIIAQARKINQPTRMLVHIKAEKLKFGELPADNPNLIYTYGCYYLKYCSLTRNGEPNYKKFMIRYDFGKQVIKCKGYRELVAQAKTNDLANFFITYTNLDPQMFKIALQNENMQIPIAFDILKYDKEMRAKWGVGEEEYAMIYNPFVEDFYVKYADDGSGGIKIINCKGDRAK